jgi:hypothetical protein
MKEECFVEELVRPDVVPVFTLVAMEAGRDDWVGVKLLFDELNKFFIGFDIVGKDDSDKRPETFVATLLIKEYDC